MTEHVVKGSQCYWYVALQVHEATVEAGAYPSPLNYGNFPKSVCTSVNEVGVFTPVPPVISLLFLHPALEEIGETKALILKYSCNGFCIAGDLPWHS